MRKLSIILGLALALASGFALGQSGLISTTLTGNEVIVAAIGGPGGPSIFIPTAEIRNAQGVATTALTSGTINLSANNADLITTAQVTGAMTLNTPSTPWDGEIFELVNGSGSNNTATITLTASGTQTVNGGAVATQANQASAEWRYVQATTTWYRLR